MHTSSRMRWTAIQAMLKGTAFSMCLLVLLSGSTQAQEYQYTRPTLWFGVAGGANFNYHRGSTQKLNDQFTSPVAFHNGNTVGLYLAPLMEYHDPSGLGLMLQLGYDSRRSVFEQQTTVCNCPADLSTNLGYVTVEPSLRLAPFGPGFYLFAGPRIAFNVAKSFTYKLGINPDFPEQPATPDVQGDLSDIKNVLLSLQMGAGYDIPLNTQDQQYQAILSPFINFQPYFGQSPRSIETWNITTLRAGAALKFGRGVKNPVPTNASDIFETRSNVRFTVDSPKNIPTMRRVNETFPLRNYVYFDEGSTAIPARYALLTKNQISDFKEDQLEQLSPKDLSGRSGREMVAYYNVLNIVGDRLLKNPASAITLVGSSETGALEGETMASSIKTYLTDVWGIQASRITTDGKDKPLIPYLASGTTKYKKELTDEDRRVSIESSSPALLMEFQSGSDARLKPVEIIGVQEAPYDSYVTFNAEGASKEFTSWRMELKDEKNRVQNFGPYYSDQVRLPGKAILGNQSQGRYLVTMIGTNRDGSMVRKTANADMVLWTPTQNEMGMRYSVIYEFDDATASNIYEKYLHTVMVPKIPAGAKVIIHGYTDIIGDKAYNKTLSLARANDVKSILQDGLSDAGRKDVTFEVRGMGQDEAYSPFGNTLPEERAYNRTVIIDIIPPK
jgi:outer membrane protein OmpA-like peptidoglycan-associated protein